MGGWRLGPGLAAGVGRRQKEGHCCGVSSLNVRAPGQRQKRETRPPSRIRILPFSKEAVRTCNPKKHWVDGWMAGCAGDVRAPAVQPRTRHSHETQVPTPNVVHSSGRGVDATQSVRSIVFGFRCWRRISSAFSKTLHSTHRMLCRSTFGGTLSRDKTRRRTMAVQWLFYARKWCDIQQKASVNLDPGPAAEAMAESLARFVHCARERGLPST